MKTLFITTTIIAVSISSGVYFHKQNNTLENEIADSKSQCAQELVELEQGLNAKLNELAAKLPEQHELRASIPANLEKPKIERLVSYGHKVRAISNKYEFLLTTVEIDEADKKVLSRLLLEREKLAAQIDELALNENVAEDSTKFEKQLAEVETRIENLLKDPVDYTRYQYLRERSL